MLISYSQEAVWQPYIVFLAASSSVSAIKTILSLAWEVVSTVFVKIVEF